MTGNDYHNYVFADGEFVGDFERMYRECDDPWHIERCFHRSIDRELIPAFIRHYRKNRGWRKPSILEIGCAKGRFTRVLARLGDVVGMDISRTAVAAARRRYPGLAFAAADIRSFPEMQRLQRRHGQFDFIAGFGFLWYVIDHYDLVMDNLRSLLRDNGVALLDLRFYRGDYYGKRIFRRPEDFARRTARHFRILERMDYHVGANGLKFVYLLVEQK